MPNSTPSRYFLPRLKPEFYRGDAVVMWSMSFVDRAEGWLDDRFHSMFRELLLHASAREGLLCPCYCLMPDHLHLIWMGLRLDTDQLNGMAFLRTHLNRALKNGKLQKQAHDHVLRDEERRRNAFAAFCSYVLGNPVRAELVKTAAEWRFMGAIVPGYPDLNPSQERFWHVFWRCYQDAREPDAGDRRLPRDKIPMSAV